MRKDVIFAAGIGIVLGALVYAIWKGFVKTASAMTREPVIAAFKDLAKEGVTAYGKHRDLAEKFRALDADGLAILQEMLRDTQSSTSRFLAAAILEDLKDPRSIAALDAAVADPDVLVARMAAHALAFMGTKEAVPPLERALNEGTDWGMRLNAAYGLSKLGEKSGTDFILEQYRRKDDPMVPLVALGAMADIGAPEFSRELRPLIGDEKAEWGLRFSAVRCAEKAKDREALPAIEALIASPATPDSLKDVAKRAVNEIRGEKVYKVE